MSDADDIIRKIIDHQKIWLIPPKIFGTKISLDEETQINQSIAIVDIFKRTVIPVVEKFEEIVLGLGRGGYNNAWSAYTFYQKEARYQRIHLERVTCSNCNTHILIGNPLVIDCYFGVPSPFDMHAAREKAYDLERKNCPICNSILPRHAVWAVENFLDLN